MDGLRNWTKMKVSKSENHIDKSATIDSSNVREES